MADNGELFVVRAILFNPGLKVGVELRRFFDI
jgi:hypothetical protein